MNKFFFLVFHFLLIDGYAADSFQNTQAKAVMGNVYESFVKIIPYIYSEKSTFDSLKIKKNQDDLIANLTDISDYFKGAKHVDFFQKPGFRPSLETINSHLDETILSIQSKNFVFAQSRLKALTALCISCHSQLSDNVAKNAFAAAVTSEKRSRFESDFAFANYLFLVRRFTEAVNYFELSINANLSIIQSQDTSLLSEDAPMMEVNSAIRRVLSIYTKVTFNPDKAINFLRKYQNKKNISKLTLSSIQTWVKSLEKWKKFDPNKVGDISTFITKHLEPLENNKEKAYGEQSDITLLVASGILSKFLTDNSETKLAPQILYWLSLSERRLSNSYFFSLSDLYLKDCITRYPTHPYARKCYQEYEDQLTFGYSGSSGTDIPKDEKRELERLKKALK